MKLPSAACIVFLCWSCTSAFYQLPQEGRKLALLVGVGTYLNPRIPTLKAPPHDVDLIRQVLSGFNGYGFDPKDITVLKNQQATLAAFRKTFEEKLIKEARPEDLVLFYFSGHGSQVCDRNGDEPIDHKDETLVLYDSRTAGKGDLIDDELRSMINRIRAENLVVILDACHSGSGTRGALGAKKALKPLDPCPDHTHKAAGRAETLMITPEKSFPGLVVMSAVTDDARSAYERETTSVFTSWLVTALSQPSAHTLTYEQLAARVRTNLGNFGQTPAFKGALDKAVFNTHQKERPIAWMVQKKLAGDRVTATGIPMPGWSPGGIVEIYDENASSDDYAASHNIKAVMTITQVTHNKAILKTESLLAGKTIRPGDYAVLQRVGEILYRIRVRLTPPHENGGISQDRAEKIKTTILKRKHLKDLVILVESHPDFEISLDEDRHIQIIGPEGTVRNRLTARHDESGQVTWILYLFSLQRHLLQLAAVPERTGRQASLTTTLAFKEDDAETPKRRPFLDKKRIFQLPSGTHFRIKVTYESGHTPMSIGGLILSSDGSIYGFPLDGDYPLLKSGDTHLFPREFLAVPPYGIEEHVLVFGTSPNSSLFWHLSQHAAQSPSASRGGRSFQDLLDFLKADRRTGNRRKNQNAPLIIGRLTYEVIQ